MRYLSLNEVLELHRRVMEQSGGAVGIHSLSGLEAALAQPRMTFSGVFRSYRPSKLVLRAS